MFGYRQKDVDVALAARDLAINAERRRVAELQSASLELAGRVKDLELVADRLAKRVVDREFELEKLLARIAALEPGAAEGSAGEDEPGENGSDPIFSGLIEVEVGPLSDFAQLIGFEDAANEIGAAGEISVKGFARGRATLEMRFDEPVALLRELEERAPFEFKVRDTRDDRVILDLDADA